MIRSTPLHPRALALTFVAAACCWSTGALAQSAPTPVQPASSPTGDTVRLTDAERMAILDANTEQSAAAARGELTDSQNVSRGVHGEVGIMIGSNGMRGAYGMAEIPLGENGEIAVAFETSRFGRRR